MAHLSFPWYLRQNSLLFIIVITSSTNGHDVPHHDESIDGMSQIRETPLISSASTIHLMPAPSPGHWIDPFQNQGRRAFGPPPLMPHSGFWHRPQVDFGHLSNAQRLPVVAMNRPGLLNQRLQQQQLQHHLQQHAENQRQQQQQQAGDQQQQQHLQVEHTEDEQQDAGNQQHHPQNKHNNNHGMLGQPQHQKQTEMNNNNHNDHHGNRHQFQQSQQNVNVNNNRPRQRNKNNVKSGQNTKARNKKVEKPRRGQQSGKRENKNAQSTTSSNDRQQQQIFMSTVAPFMQPIHHMTRPLTPVIPVMFSAVPNTRNQLRFPMRPSVPQQMQPAMFPRPHNQFVFEPTINMPIGLGSGALPNFMNLVATSPQPPVVNIRGPVPVHSVTEPSAFHSNDISGQAQFPLLHQSTTMAPVQRPGPAFSSRPEFVNNPPRNENLARFPAVFIRHPQVQLQQQHTRPPIRIESGHGPPMQQDPLPTSSIPPQEFHPQPIVQMTTSVPFVDHGPWRPLVRRQPFPWRPLDSLHPGPSTGITLGTTLAPFQSSTPNGFIMLSTTNRPTTFRNNDMENKFKDVGIRSSEGEYLSNDNAVSSTLKTSSSLGVSATVSSDMLNSPIDNTMVPISTSSVASDVAKQPMQTQALVSELLTLVKSVADSPHSDESTETTQNLSGTVSEAKNDTKASSVKIRKSRKRPLHSYYRQLISRRTPSISFRPTSTIGVTKEVETYQEASSTVDPLLISTSDVVYKGNTKQNDYDDPKKPYFGSLEQYAGKNFDKDMERAFLSYIDKPTTDSSPPDWSNRMDKIKNFSYFISEPDKFDITSGDFEKAVFGAEQQDQLGAKTQQELRLQSSDIVNLLTKIQEDAFLNKLNGKQESHLVSDDPNPVNGDNEKGTSITSSEVVSSGLEDMSSNTSNNVLPLNSEEVQIESGFSMSSPEVDDRQQHEDSSEDVKVTKNTKKEHQDVDVSELSENGSNDDDNSNSSTESNVSYNSKKVSPIRRKLVVRVRRRKYRSTSTAPLQVKDYSSST